MKAVLMSIQAKWCEKIANGEKTIEVRKRRPKLETPFKVYIYCTKEKSIYDMLLISNEKGFEKCVSFGDYRNHGFGWEIGNRKIIGEFVCDRIDEYIPFEAIELISKYEKSIPLLKESCLTVEELGVYIGDKNANKNFYGWHISELKIYDKPKELREFKTAGERCKMGWTKCGAEICGIYPCDYMVLKRPSQSWCYVEGLQNG